MNKQMYQMHQNTIIKNASTKPINVKFLINEINKHTIDVKININKYLIGE